MIKRTISVEMIITLLQQIILCDYITQLCNHRVPVTVLGGGREVMPSQFKLQNTDKIAKEWQN